jgi:hypothetical protein
MLDEVAVGRHLGDVERALDLVHHGDALALHGLGEGDDGVRPAASPDLVVVYGRVQGVELEIGVAEPVAQFGDLRLVVVVEVLAGAENLDRGDAGLPDPSEQGGGQAVINEYVRRQIVVHLDQLDSIALRAAVYATRTGTLPRPPKR